MTQQYASIPERAESLSPEEQLQLISDLARSLSSRRGERRTSILELQGLGKDIWDGVDAQEYVNRERASWNG